MSGDRETIGKLLDAGANRIYPQEYRTGRTASGDPDGSRGELYFSDEVSAEMMRASPRVKTARRTSTSTDLTEMRLSA